MIDRVTFVRDAAAQGTRKEALDLGRHRSLRGRSRPASWRGIQLFTGYVEGMYFYRLMVLDIYGQKIVEHEVHCAESLGLQLLLCKASLAEDFIWAYRGTSHCERQLDEKYRNAGGFERTRLGGVVQ